MNYSYTQISHYLSCPRRYRYRYLDGWVEKIRREESRPVTVRQLVCVPKSGLEYSRGETWDSMLESGIHLIERFVQDGRVETRPNLQINKPQREASADYDPLGETVTYSYCGAARSPRPSRAGARAD